MRKGEREINDNYTRHFCKKLDKTDGKAEKGKKAVNKRKRLKSLLFLFISRTPGF